MLGLAAFEQEQFIHGIEDEAYYRARAELILRLEDCLNNTDLKLEEQQEILNKIKNQL